MSQHEPSRLQELTSQISINTSIYSDYLRANGWPQPSFSTNTTPKVDLPPDMVKVRNTVLEASEELQALMLGPIGHLQRQTLDHTNLIGIHAVHRYRIAEAFPVGSEASYTQISNACALSETQVRRIMRYTMTKYLFTEPTPGFVAHTAASKVLAESQSMRDWIGMVCEEMWPAAARTVEAMTKWAESEEPQHTGFAYANNTENAIFAELSEHPERAQRFANAMSMISQEEGYEPYHLLKAFAWSSKDPLILVDIGGSHGMVSIALAQEVDNVRCIVQDLPSVVEEGRSRLPRHLSNKVHFMAHDFFAVQPVKAADVYFFRWIFHDWSDKYCVRLLRALVPALKDGARIIISDFTMPPPGQLSRYDEWLIRAFDLAMLELFNSKEREADGWTSLLNTADERFQFVEISVPPGSKLSFVEARWNAGLQKV